MCTGRLAFREATALMIFQQLVLKEKSTGGHVCRKTFSRFFPQNPERDVSFYQSDFLSPSLVAVVLH
jgi:hypothetical protein